MPEPMGWPEDPDTPHPEPAKSLLVEDGLEIISPVDKDAEELFIIVDENRSYLREWLPWLDDVTSVDDEIALIRSLSEKKDNNFCFYLIRQFGNLVGVISLNWVDWSNRSFGLGYWVSQSSSGQGIVTKACSRLIDHCFDDLMLHRSVIEVAVENYPSRKVAEGLGMRLEGVSKDREWLYDHYTDSSLYAITAPEWKSLSQG
jgi:ribosomal-protein-serine acetyltransferase|tara:strand:- start:3152 stop:3757 length:606 start_codon:yes stop_codon:yes gene_type:complete